MSLYGQLVKENNIRYILDEAFVGKTETLLEIEKQIGIVRNSIKKFTDINKSKEVQKLNRLFEKQFGMEVFALHIIQSQTINAYTFPINTRFDVALKQNISKMVEGSKTEGYKFKPNNGLGIICCCYYGLISNPEFTDAEIVAVILHELGHNFADALYNKIRVANKNSVKEYYGWLIFKTIMTFGLGYKDIANNKNKNIVKKEKSKIKHPLKGFIAGIKGKKDDFSNFVSEVLGRLTGAAMWNLTKIGIDEEKQKNYVKGLIGRQNEVIADKFAGVYGYAPDQVSALLKMDSFKTNAEKFVEKIPLIGKICNDSFNNATKDLCNFDVHPHVIQRAYEEIKLLKDELQKEDLDPKVEKIIKDQINQIETMIKDAQNLVNESRKSEDARIAFYKFINDTDQDAVTDEIEDAIHDALNKGLEKK